MRGYQQPIYDTPVGMGRRVAVVGAGNTAMDSARVALRMGAEQVSIVYRRSRRESPARAEELEHAIQEGIQFRWLTNPVEILGNSAGWVTGLRCQEMELGEPDASGRRRPVPKPGSEFELDVDTVIYALGTTANPIIAQTTPGLRTNKWGYIETERAHRHDLDPGRIRRRRYRHRGGHRDPGHGRRTPRRPRHAGVHGGCYRGTGGRP